VTTPDQGHAAIPHDVVSAFGPEAAPAPLSGPVDLAPAVELVDTSWVRTELVFHEPPVPPIEEVSR
jgi:hypothetical protein